MDKDTRTARPPVDAPGSGARRVDSVGEPNGSQGLATSRSPEQIRADIEHTREQVGDTVQALAEKIDVKRQAQQRVAEAKAALQHKRDELTARARSTTPEIAQQTSRQMLAKVRSDPAPVVLGAAAFAAFLLGRLTGRRS